MDTFPSILNAGSVILRPVERRDLEQVVRHLADPRVYPWLAAVPHPFTPEDADAFYGYSQNPTERVRVLERDGDVLGCLCLGTAVWYWLDPAHWGQGLMKTAMDCALAAYFTSLVPPLVATSREDNPASLSLLARLGFSRAPTGRRMFFHGTESAHPCRDYVMTPEQWHFLHPPRLASNGVTLHPARQKDAELLSRMLPRSGGPSSEIWPGSDPFDLSRFIETHRHRGNHTGLFVIQDDDRRPVGVVLRRAGEGPNTLFLTPEDARRHGDSVGKLTWSG
ncbi:GNAT family N-acetyltransferase [Tropicimonas isoalkanivorans]|uniref:Protein N-acetyltransferase, RimJ/RimL family n=1 Tax=Tropicimonas isoalkanivorans TaxID=441112 RepID=A0A1I1QED3_9RHOB|nr:GNAT family N-acetyltransferase [Tropicimonas isoalkanivorans]SFD20342.1 Protein N-acetyltransferase, RimJ/RimL family [Tropicimonas isoalkanivorans]